MGGDPISTDQSPVSLRFGAKKGMGIHLGLSDVTETVTAILWLLAIPLVEIGC